MKPNEPHLPRIRIRPALPPQAWPSDWEAIREICCLTGKAGDPIENERWTFFAENWVGPYQRLLPDWTWVAESETSEIVGYLTACPDTPTFERKRLWSFDFPLIAKILFSHYPRNTDAKRYLRRRFFLDATPESLFPDPVKSQLGSRYPAHLHINLRASHRKGGVGRLLMEACFESLRNARISGVHVHCGAKPVPFYERTGFEELGRIEFAPGIPIFCLGKRL